MAYVKPARVAVAIEHTGDRRGRAIQQQTKKVAQQANSVRPGMVTISGLTFAVGTNSIIAHGLGRIPTGWNIVRPRNWAAVAGTITACVEIASDDRTLTLGPFAGFTADLEVW